MKRFFTFVAVALLCATTGLALVATQAQEKPAAEARGRLVAPNQQLASMYDESAKMCAECMVCCEKTAFHCNGMISAGKAEHVAAMKTAADCAECCKLCATFCARQSTMCPASCEFCAKACDECAAACEKFADSTEMKACADTCKKCAASCRAMGKMTAAK